MNRARLRRFSQVLKDIADRLLPTCPIIAYLNEDGTIQGKRNYSDWADYAKDYPDPPLVVIPYLPTRDNPA